MHLLLCPQLSLPLALSTWTTVFTETADPSVKDVQAAHEHSISNHFLLSHATLHSFPPSTLKAIWGPCLVLWGAFQNSPGSQCYHAPRTWPSPHSSDQPLWGVGKGALRVAIQEHPERSLCRPGAPSLGRLPAPPARLPAIITVSPL